MKLVSSRSLSEMRPVLFEKDSTGPDPVYSVFNELENSEWVNQTVISFGRYGHEFPKTFGHYHGTPVPEIYMKISGSGILLLQKKHFEKGVWIPEVVDEVILIKADHGDKIKIMPEYGHSWSNVGNEELITMDDWTNGHAKSDYDMIEKLCGMAYFLVEDESGFKAIANEKYRDLPQVKIITAKEFSKLQN